MPLFARLLKYLFIVDVPAAFVFVTSALNIVVEYIPVAEV